MEWLNEPPAWGQDGDRLWVETGDKTDFWRVTHYGFVRDDGHLFHQRVDGDFTATVRFRGRYEEFYDQAGLMVRIDERNWIKAGIEYTEGIQHVSAVVTREFSDWSVLPLSDPPEWLWLRLVRKGDAVQVEWSLDGERFEMLRMAYLPLGPALVGPMCCSPQRKGFRVQFEGFEVL